MILKPFFLRRLGSSVKFYCLHHFSTSASSSDPNYVRNIGILAHIDAGKTTTTERMLFYSGMINNMGEVHQGNTVTDFMDQERKRGITITAASVTFPWGDHTINLIDTPGHIDFTMEVEQTLNVLDGAVVVLDASAGVEAQTKTVWRQAARYKIPRLVYVNKMDRPDAGFFSSVDSLKVKLGEVPLVLQLPYVEGSSFRGIIDVINMELKVWDGSSLGENVTQRKVDKADGQMWVDAMAARRTLTDTLADFDDELAEYIITDEVPLEKVPERRLRDSVKNLTIRNQAYPVLCGSSYKNIGVQALMDAVTMYLPPPSVRSSSSLVKNFGQNLFAKAFKVRHDAHKGPLTFLRIFAGKLKKGQKIYNMRLEGAEVASKLFVATADDYKEVNEAGVGGIVAVSGFKGSMTGDLITSSASAANSSKKLTSNLNIDNLDAVVPQPVFFCSIECPSQAYQATLDRALSELSREDPSLRVRMDEETGQTVLSGMGELHLDVIKERIRQEYRVDVQLGPLQISYKEYLINSAKDTHIVNLQIGSSHHSVKLTMSVEPCENPPKDIVLDRSPEYASSIAAIFPRNLPPAKAGVQSALNRGPLLSCPVTNVKVTLHSLEVGRGTSESVITAAASQCVKKLLAMGKTQLLEPIMELQVSCPSDTMSAVVADLNRRRVSLDNFSSRGLEKVVVAYVPLSELLGYASRLRSITSGQASFSMQLHSLKTMSPFDEAKAIKSVTGLDPL